MVGSRNTNSDGSRGRKRLARGKGALENQTELRKRVGAFVRERRTALGLSQGDVIKTLGYKSRSAVSNIELGVEGLPTKKAYAWADLLNVPRDLFFRFASGEITEMEDAEDRGAMMNNVEAELLGTYRRLPAHYQRRLIAHAAELEILAKAAGKRS